MALPRSPRGGALFVVLVPQCALLAVEEPADPKARKHNRGILSDRLAARRARITGQISLSRPARGLVHQPGQGEQQAVDVSHRVTACSSRVLIASPTRRRLYILILWQLRSNIRYQYGIS